MHKMDGDTVILIPHSYSQNRICVPSMVKLRRQDPMSASRRGKAGSQTSAVPYRSPVPFREALYHRCTPVPQGIPSGSLPMTLNRASVIATVGPWSAIPHRASWTFPLSFLWEVTRRSAWLHVLLAASEHIPALICSGEHSPAKRLFPFSAQLRISACVQDSNTLYSPPVSTGQVRCLPYS